MIAAHQFFVHLEHATGTVMLMAHGIDDQRLDALLLEMLNRRQVPQRAKWSFEVKMSELEAVGIAQCATGFGVDKTDVATSNPLDASCEPQSGKRLAASTWPHQSDQQGDFGPGCLRVLKLFSVCVHG